MTDATKHNGGLEEVGTTSRGYTIFREGNEVGGHRYWSDEIGGGVMVWDTCLADSETLRRCLEIEAALAHAREAGAQEPVAVPAGWEEAIRLAEVGEFLFSARLYSYGDGRTEPREMGIDWQWQQSAPNQYGQGVLLAEANKWHDQQAEDGTITEARKLRAAIFALPVQATDVDRAKMAANLVSIADASRRVDGSDIPLGETLRNAAAMLAAAPVSPAAEPYLGWLYHNEDTGIEWSEQHPVESGEVPDATDVRPATLENLKAQLVEAWQTLSEMRGERVSPAADSEDVERLISDAWDRLLNVDDRTSPEEYPEMALIQFDELAGFMCEVALASHTLAPQPGGAVKVKALEWSPVEHERSNEDPTTEIVGYEASTGFWCHYSVEITGGGATLTNPEYSETEHASPDAAKAAAQADYERRILSALEPSPSQWNAGAEAMREDCAAHIDAHVACGSWCTGAEIRALPLPTPAGEG